MSIRSLLAGRLGRGFDRRARRRGGVCHSRRLLRHEPLEDRRLLSTTPGWLVTAGPATVWNQTLDDANNVFITGEFSGTVDFDPNGSHPGDSDILTSAGKGDVFVAKYEPDGSLAWVRQMGGSESDVGRAIAIDNTGNIRVAGYFGLHAHMQDDGGQADFNPDPNETAILTSAGGVDIFVVNLDANGSFVWANRAGGAGDDHTYSLDIDSDGNVYVAGQTGGSADFGSHTINDKAGFVARLDPAGNFDWVNPVGGAGLGVAVDDVSSSIYVVGHFAGDVDFGQTPGGDSVVLSSHGTSDAYVLKTDTDGRVLWVCGFSSDYSSLGKIAVDGDGDGSIFATGGFRGTVTAYDQTGPLNGESVTSVGEMDVFVVKLTSDGDSPQMQRFGGPSEDRGYGIAVDAGQVYFTGFFRETASFEGDQATVTSGGGQDAFLAVLDAADLTPRWIRQVEGELDHWAWARPPCVDSEGLVYFTGYFAGTALFPNGEVRTSVGGQDFFLMKYNPYLKTISGTVFADLNNNGINDDGAAVPEGWTLYLDLDRDGTLDSGEPTTTTVGSAGHFTFSDVVPDATYRIAQQVAPGWTETSGPQEVNVSGSDVGGVELGAYVPTVMTTYQAPPDEVGYTIRDGGWAYESWLDIPDSARSWTWTYKWTLREGAFPI